MLTLHTQVSQDHMLCADACLFPASIFSRHAEITHNIHGPHDAQFYKLMDELWEVRLHALEIRRCSNSRSAASAAALLRAVCTLHQSKTASLLTIL